jgi:hypothetical protein
MPMHHQGEGKNKELIQLHFYFKIPHRYKYTTEVFLRNTHCLWLLINRDKAASLKFLLFRLRDL